MKIDRRHLRPTLLAALAALFLIAAAGCSGDQEIASTSAETAELPDQELFDYVLTESEAGVPSWELSSDRLERFLKKADVEDEVELFGVRMRFYRDGEPFSLLTSERGRANLKKKEIFTWGDVVVVTTDGRRLETDQLHYDNEKGLIYNEVYNKFTRDGDVMTGFGMEATPDLEFFELKRRVNASVIDKPREDGADDDAQ